MRPNPIKNPDQDPDLSKLDVVRRWTRGETPAERLARVEEEQRRRPERILDRAGRNTRKKRS